MIGSAGSAEKIDYITGRLGFDEAFNYKDGDVTGQLAKAAPEGIDVYFDNVGGDHLEAAIANANTFGRSRSTTTPSRCQGRAIWAYPSANA